MRRIPPAGINLFQLIYVLIDEYKRSSGREPLNLSLGNPDGIPPEAIRRLKARYGEDPGYDYHTYAESRDLRGFAEAMVELHGGVRVSEHPGLAALPIPGIKTASALAPLACGLHLPDAGRRSGFRVASNLPAYDVIGTWAGSYLGARRTVWPLVAAEDMRLSVARLREALKKDGADRADLVFVIRPGNPAAVGATAAEWRELAALCVEKGMRLVNDAAYAGLAAPGTHASLASVAKDVPGLEWLELYSVSKSFNDPGARLGALVGTRDFVDDFLLVKGNTDSGPVPGVMAAYGDFLADRAAARAALDGIRGLYEKRLEYVIPRLKAAGLRPACSTSAGFFTLWKVPESVLGRALPAEGRAEAFNRAVISELGLVGVHFTGQAADGTPEPLIRYAVCADVLSPSFRERFEAGLARLKPAYR